MDELSVDIEGNKVVYYKRGTGSPLIFLPGLGCSCHLWIKVMERLEKKFQMYAFDLPTYGSTMTDGSVFTLKTAADYLGKILRFFKIDRPVLIGHSLGGIISLIYSAEHPADIRKLICVSSPFSDRQKPVPLSWRLADKVALSNSQIQSIFGWLMTRNYLIDNLRPIVFPGRNMDEIKKELSKKTRSMPLKSLALCFKDIFEFDPRPYVQKLTVPAALVYGTEDMPLLKFRGTSLYDKIPGAKITKLPSQHFIPIDEPEKMAEIIEEFANN